MKRYSVEDRISFIIFVLFTPLKFYIMFDFATSSALLTTLVTSLLTKASMDLYNSSKDKSQETFKKALNDLRLNDKIHAYYEATTGSFNPIKTFMFRENGVPFYSIYYHIAIRRNNPNTNSKEILNVDKDIKNIFTNNKCITVIGSAGSGKTMLVKHLFLSAVKEAELIPVMVEFRKIDNSETIHGFIKGKIFNLLKVDDTLFDSIINSGKFLFILDGYDEIPGTILAKRVKEIENFTEKYFSNYYFLTSRPGVEAEVLPRFSTYHICDLKEKDIFPFIDQQCMYITEGYTLAKKIKEAIKKAAVINAYDDYFKNPLLLSMFITVFNDYPDLPSSKCEYYENVFEVLWLKHDSGKGGGYNHEKNYDKKMYEQLLSAFCYRTFFEGKYSFTENYLNKELKEAIEKRNLDCNIDKVKNDLISNISILFKDGKIYTFPHRSMQEYFAAKYVAERPETIKLKFYTEKIENFFIKSELCNLLSLLSEIDKYYCLKFYVLPNLNKIANDLERDGTSEDLILKSFFRIFSYYFYSELGFADYDRKTIYSGFLSSIRDITEIYFNIDYFIFEIFQFKEKDKLDIFPITTYKGILDEQPRPYHLIKADTFEQKNCLRKLGITKEVIDFYHHLKEMIKDMNQFIKREDESEL